MDNKTLKIELPILAYRYDCPVVYIGNSTYLAHVDDKTLEEIEVNDLLEHFFYNEKMEEFERIALLKINPREKNYCEFMEARFICTANLKDQRYCRYAWGRWDSKDIYQCEFRDSDSDGTCERQAAKEDSLTKPQFEQKAKEIIKKAHEVAEKIENCAELTREELLRIWREHKPEKSE